MDPLFQYYTSMFFCRQVEMTCTLTDYGKPQEINYSRWHNQTNGDRHRNAFFWTLKRPLNTIVERNLKRRLQLRKKCKSHKNYSLYPIFIFAVPRRLSSLMFHNKPNRDMRKCLWKTRVRVKHVVRSCHVHWFRRRNVLNNYTRQYEWNVKW